MASCKNCGHEVEHFVEGGDVPTPEQSNAPEPQAPQAPVVVNVGAPPAAPTPVPVPAVPLAPAAVKPPAPTLAAPAPQAAADPNAPTDFKMPQTVQDSINQPSPMQMMREQFQQHKDAHMADLVDGDQKFESDLVNGHITPKTYQTLFADKTTLGKIGSIFGLLVGGAGSGLAHQQNALLSAWDKQISNDLEAQKQSKANAQNFLRINQADLANKASALGGIENAKAMAVETTRKQMVQVSYHKMLEDIKKLPPAQQAKARHLLMILHPEMMKVLGNSNDLMSSAAATQGMSNPLDQAPPSGDKTQTGKATPGPAKPQANAQPQVSGHHILGDGANDAITSAINYNPRFMGQKEAIMDQKSKAALADKAIDTINDYFGKLTDEAGKSGYIQRKAHMLDSVPIVGKTMSGMMGAITDVPSNRAYASDHDQLVGALRGALQGNVSMEDVEKIVENSSPEASLDVTHNKEPKELLDKKRQNLVNFVRSHIKTDLLENIPGVMNKKPKK